MPDTWDDLTGGLRPRGFSDVKDGLQKVIKTGSIKFNKKDDGDIKTVSESLWDAAGEDPETLIEAMDATIRKRANISYLFGCLRRGKSFPSNNAQKQEVTPPEKPAQVKNEPRPNGASKRDETFILLYRSIRHHPWFKKKPIWVKLMFIEFCLDAAWKDHDVWWKNDWVPLKRGQWIILEWKLAEEYEQSQQMVNYWLKKLSNEGMIKAEILNYKGGKFLSANLSGRLSGCLSEGTLITICKYDDYQAQKDDNLSANLSGFLSGNLSQTEQGNKQNNEEHNKGDNPSSNSLKNIITREEIFDIWEKEKGPLPRVEVRQSQNVSSLQDHLNSLIGSPPHEHWRNIIHKARQCHPSHYPFMCPAFMSKDLEHINQILRGVYDRAFERKRFGKPSFAERPGRGNAEEFGGEAGEGVERAKRISDAFKSPDV